MTRTRIDRLTLVVGTALLLSCILGGLVYAQDQYARLGTIWGLMSGRGGGGGSGSGGGTTPFAVRDSSANIDSDTIVLNNIAAGDVVVLGIKWTNDAATNVSVSDGTSSLAMRAVVSNTGGTNMRTSIAHITSSVATGTVTYTVTWPASTTFKRIVAYAFSHPGTASVVTASSGVDTSAYAATGPIDTSANSVVFGFAATNAGTLSNPLIATSVADGSKSANAYNMGFYKVFTTAQSGIDARATLDNIQQWIIRCVSFKEE